MIDTEHRDMPVCPHCGHEDRTPIVGFLFSNRFVCKCSACKRPFWVKPAVTVTYTTSIQKPKP